MVWLCVRGVCSWFVVRCVLFVVVCWCGSLLLVSLSVCWFDGVRVVLFPKVPDEVILLLASVWVSVVLFPKVPDEGSVVDLRSCFVW